MKCALKWWKPLRMPTGRWNVRGSSTLASSYQKDWLFFFWKGLRGLVRLVRLVRCWLWKAGWQLVELECKFAGSKYSTMFPWLRRGIPWYLVESSAMPKEQRSIPVGWTAFVALVASVLPCDTKPGDAEHLTRFFLASLLWAAIRHVWNQIL